MGYQKRNSFLLLIILLSFQLSLANPNPVDSLQGIISNPDSEIPEILKAYTAIVYHYEVLKPDTALLFGQRGLHLKGSEKYPKELALLHQNIAFVHFSMQNFEQAIKYFKNTYYYNEETENIIGLGLQCANIGNSYRRLGKYEEAINYYLESLKHYETINDLDGIVYANIYLGNIYYFQEKPLLAEPYYLNAKKLSPKLKDKFVEGDVCTSLGLVYERLNELEKSEAYHIKAANLYSAVNNEYKKVRAEHNLAAVYIKAERFEEAEVLLKNVLKYFRTERRQSTVEIAVVKLNLGKVYLNTGKLTQSIELIKEAVKVLDEFDVLTEKSQGLSYLAKAYSLQGQFKKAYNTELDYVHLKDSLQSDKLYNTIAELTEKYEAERKEKEINSLKLEKEKQAQYLWNLGLSLIILILIGGGGFLNFRHKSNFKNKLVENELLKKNQELNVLQTKIKKGITQYSVPGEFNMSREEVNSLLNDRLTERELDVFCLMAKGLTNKEIGEGIFVSVNTVKFHLQNIYIKLDVENRSDAVKAIAILSPLEN